MQEMMVFLRLACFKSQELVIRNAEILCPYPLVHINVKWDELNESDAKTVHYFLPLLFLWHNIDAEFLYFNLQFISVILGENQCNQADIIEKSKKKNLCNQWPLKSLQSLVCHLHNSLPWKKQKKNQCKK